MGMKPRSDGAPIGSAKLAAVAPESYQYVADAIDVAVRSGFGSRADVMVRVSDLLAHDTGGVLQSTDISAWLDEVRDQLREQRALEQSWAKQTHNDKIDAAFRALRTRGIVAVQDAGYTMSDGWEDVHDARRSVKGARGGVFFHGQDVERGVKGEGLRLAFGAFAKGADHERESLRLAREICSVLADHGVKTEWDGTLAARIFILPFKWQKRRDM